MARAHRHFIPGYIWHLTHRCHQGEFLLKFARDRNRWLRLLFEARKRYDLSILNFVVTCNHIHLIVSDRGDPIAIPKAIQYVAGRTGQEYNRRKNRKGAFWEDRYHATAVQSGEHLWKCLVYVDLNMVRAGVVNHPRQWRWNGFNEIQNPKKRYGLIDHRKLHALLGVETPQMFITSHNQWIETMIKKKRLRQESYSKSLAIGSRAFVMHLKKVLGVRAIGRHIHPIVGDYGYQLKETVSAYGKLIQLIEHIAAEEDGNINLIPWVIN